MHGLIFHKLKAFSQQHYGKNAWATWLTKAELDPYTFYLPGMAYPDEEIVMILSAATQEHSIEMHDLLHQFGRFLAPELLQIFPLLIKSEWRTLDLIENTGKIIHDVVRDKIVGADPPTLETTRQSPTHLSVNYRSARRLCTLFEGVVAGVSNHYGETISLEHTSCMLKGDDECIYEIRIVGKGTA